MRFHVQKFFINFQSDGETRAIFYWHGCLDFWITYSERFPDVCGKVKQLLLLVFPTTYVSEQGFSQVLHMHSKYRNRLDINMTSGNAMAIPFKLTNLQSALKKLTNEKPGARFVVVGINCFRKLNIFSTNSIAFVLFVRFFVLSRLPVYFISIDIFSN